MSTKGLVQVHEQQATGRVRLGVKLMQSPMVVLEPVNPHD
jgi:hypothetical protein